MTSCCQHILCHASWPRSASSLPARKRPECQHWTQAVVPNKPMLCHLLVQRTQTKTWRVSPEVAQFDELLYQCHFCRCTRKNRFGKRLSRNCYSNWDCSRTTSRNMLRPWKFLYILHGRGHQQNGCRSSSTSLRGISFHFVLSMLPTQYALQQRHNLMKSHMRDSEVQCTVFIHEHLLNLSFSFYSHISQMSLSGSHESLLPHVAKFYSKAPFSFLLSWKVIMCFLNVFAIR